MINPRDWYLQAIVMALRLVGLWQHKKKENSRCLANQMSGLKLKTADWFSHQNSGSLIGYSSDDTRMHHPQKETQELPRLIKISRTPSLFSLFVLLLVSGLSLIFWLIIWMTLTLFLGQCTDWWQIHESNSTNCSPNSVHDVSREPWNCLVSHVACEQPSVQLDNVLIL